MAGRPNSHFLDKCASTKHLFGKEGPMKPRTSFSILLVFLLCHGLGLAQQIPSLVAQHGYADMNSG